MTLYFAYGSNLLHQRLQRRCPSARPTGTGHAPGWRVGFAKYSWMDGSGKATILAEAGAATYGVLYRLVGSDLATLDAIEGVGKGYYRLDGIEVRTASATVTATTYIATDPREGQRPFDWYLGLVIAGALQNSLPDPTLADLRGVDYDPDPDADRPTRIEAEDLLTTHSGPDWRARLLCR